MTQKVFIPLLIVIVLLAGLFVFGRGAKKETATMNGVITPTVREEEQAVVEEETATQESTLTLEITSPQDGATVSSSTITVTGKTAPNIQVFVNEKELIADTDGNFSTTIELFEGENVIFVVANNNVGDYVERELTVTLESTE